MLNLQYHSLAAHKYTHYTDNIYQPYNLDLCSFLVPILWNFKKTYTVETRNLEVPGTCKNNSKHPEIDSSESGVLHVIEI